MLLEYKLEIYIDHNQIVHVPYIIVLECGIRWELILEEYIPEIVYVPIPSNMVSNAMIKRTRVYDVTETKKVFSHRASTTTH